VGTISEGHYRAIQTRLERVFIRRSETSAAT
jgi:hypothetical protein